MKNWLKLILSILLVELVGILSSIGTLGSIQTWYASLVKPSFNPPNWIFGPVWTILYLMIGIALFLVWSNKVKIKDKINAYQIFTIQLLLNALWTLVFFGMHQIFWALIVIVLLLIAIALTIREFYKISKIAAYILLPYILWVIFASLLNLSFFILN